MERKPRDPQESIFAKGRGRTIVEVGLVMSIVVLIGFHFFGGDTVHARTLAFSTLVFAQLFHTVNCRSEEKSVFEVGFFTNTYLVAAVLVSAILQVSVVHVPVLQPLFETVSLGVYDWILIVVLSSVVIMVAEVKKKLRRTALLNF